MTDQHPGEWLPYDADLVASIAAAMDLRDPNAKALDEIVQAITSGDGREVIADLATGVGKTYLAAGLVEYLARSGKRDVLIVTPGSTIQRKTIENFTPGSRKHVPGAQVEPVLITADNFQRGDTGDALHDLRRLKLFVFNVQQLIAPAQNASRRTRREDETIGGALYDHLRESDDLVVIADEHHVYRERAKAFNAAISDLSARAVIGLTATPDPADVAAKKVVSRYTLAEAIADRLVKVPVIVYRQDGRKDIDTQLADACRLRELKEPSWAGYASAASAPFVAPVLFVVCQTIADAEGAAAILTREDLLPGENQVLLITSQSTDVALDLLARVDAPDSPVRAIVSVDKLKEGWDVRNIGVIVALRALASQTLTEQVIGRGLRLPFGTRTDLGAIDHLDLVAHESYRELLSGKDALLERLQSSATSTGSEEQIELDFSPLLAGDTPPQGFTVTTVPDASLDGVGPAELLLAEEMGATERRAELDRDAVAQTMPLHPDAVPFTFPREKRMLTPVRFSLSSVDLIAAEHQGSVYRHDPAVKLMRREISAERDLHGEVTVTERAVDGFEATQEYVPGERVRRDLLERVLRDGLVEPDVVEQAQAGVVVDAFLRGAGITGEVEVSWSRDRAIRAIDAIGELIRTAWKATERRPNLQWDPVPLPGPRARPAETLDRWAGFRRGAWYHGWDRSIQGSAQFDSGTGEFALARKLDDSESVRWWLRLYTNGEAFIDWGRGRYFPDFVVLDTDGEYWVVEAKSDDAARTDTEVAAKASAARAWADRVNASRTFGTWHYLLVTESQIATAPNWDALTARE